MEIGRGVGNILLHQGDGLGGEKKKRGGGAGFATALGNEIEKKNGRGKR